MVSAVPLMAALGTGEKAENRTAQACFSPAQPQVQ